MRAKGFTLIELLIVVAIIAILAMIAVPNFLEAQTRSKVAKIRTDFRTVLVAMEAYRVDWNEYPPDMAGSGPMAGSSWYADLRPLTRLTTPVAYITKVPTNPFFDIRQSQAPDGTTGIGNYAYWGGDRHPDLVDPARNLFWHIISCGPNLVSELGSSSLQANLVLNRGPDFVNRLYDPTNGTVSYGDVHMSNRGMTF